MKQLFLTSSVHAVAHHIARQIDLSKKNKLTFIYTASEVEEGGLQAPWNQNDRKALVQAGFKVQDYTITNKTKKQIEQDLGDFHYLYFSGGNTFHL